jgi:hypothetical protein
MTGIDVHVDVECCQRLDSVDNVRIFQLRSGFPYIRVTCSSPESL